MYVGAYEKKYQQEFDHFVGPKVASGEIKYAEDRRVGIDAAAEALLDVLQGKNIGKAVVIVDEDDQE